MTGDTIRKLMQKVVTKRGVQINSFLSAASAMSFSKVLISSFRYLT